MTSVRNKQAEAAFAGGAKCFKGWMSILPPCVRLGALATWEAVFCSPSERGKVDLRAPGTSWAGALPGGAVSRVREVARSYGRELVAFQGHTEGALPSILTQHQLGSAA